MKEFIAWVLLGIAAIGGLYAVALMFYFFSLPKGEEGDSYCDCGCGGVFPMDICSSECDQKCQDNNHYEWND